MKKLIYLVYVDEMDYLDFFVIKAFSSKEFAEKFIKTCKEFDNTFLAGDQKNIDDYYNNHPSQRYFGPHCEYEIKEIELING